MRTPWHGHDVDGFTPRSQTLKCPWASPPRTRGVQLPRDTNVGVVPSRHVSRCIVSLRPTLRIPHPPARDQHHDCGDGVRQDVTSLLRGVATPNLAGSTSVGISTHLSTRTRPI